MPHFLYPFSHNVQYLNPTIKAVYWADCKSFRDIGKYTGNELSLILT